MNKICLVLFSAFLFICSSPVMAKSFLDIVKDVTGLSESEEVDSDGDEHRLHQDAKVDSIQGLILDDEFAPAKNIVTRGVLLHGLDKETARVFAMEAKVGESIQFGNLILTVQHCEKTPRDRRPEAMAFITIDERRDVEMGEAATIFSGWMFSSSPALSALDHPVYDIWVKDCINVTANDPAE